VQIGAVLMWPSGGKEASDGEKAGSHRNLSLNSVPDAAVDILGQNLVERTAARLRKAGVKSVTLIPAGPTLSELSDARSPMPSAWERAVAHWVRHGAELLLLLRADSYADLEYEDLLRFHLERKATLTEVYAPHASLDMAVVDASRLRASDDTYRTTLCRLICDEEAFLYGGYVNPLRKPAHFTRLIEDALYGRCGLRPVGTEVASGLWFGDGAEVDSSCVIQSPAFIGAGTRVAACATVSRGSAIEHDCEIDSGTAIDQSWILEGTYVGVGLNVRRSIVSEHRMFLLDRKMEVAITDGRLIGTTRWFPQLGTGTGFSNRLPFYG
jgi:hypothetical protein